MRRYPVLAVLSDGAAAASLSLSAAASISANEARAFGRLCVGDFLDDALAVGGLHGDCFRGCGGGVFAGPQVPFIERGRLSSGRGEMVGGGGGHGGRGASLVAVRSAAPGQGAVCAGRGGPKP